MTTKSIKPNLAPSARRNISDLFKLRKLRRSKSARRVKGKPYSVYESGTSKEFKFNTVEAAMTFKDRMEKRFPNKWYFLS